uniref:Uncharacterized protein n=1 Tax=Triticum urartu TaxID=4572 RepID=A0A8R7R2Q7_TRIUA
LSEGFHLYLVRAIDNFGQRGRDALEVVVAEQANSVRRKRLHLSGNGKDGIRGTAVAFAWLAACHACLGSAAAGASAAKRRG